MHASQQALLNRCPDATRSALWPQSQGVTIAILEGIHFFLDDVGDLPYRALEQRCLLDDRQTYLSIAIIRQEIRHRALQEVPVRCFLRQDVVHPADSSYIAHTLSVISANISQTTG